jgi:hypothetical protein
MSIGWRGAAVCGLDTEEPKGCKTDGVDRIVQDALFQSNTEKNFVWRMDPPGNVFKK